MAFSDYKSIAQVQAAFPVTYLEENFIVASDVQPDAIFLREFAFTLSAIDVYTSEAARAEAVIFPILREVYKGYHERFALWIQKAIAYDTQLSGTPDYLVATKSAQGKTMLAKPLVLIAEAKKNDFEQGWGQCLAELVAAQKINDDAAQTVYGVVTDGKLWEFGKLTGDRFTKNIEGLTVDQLPRLFGALHFVFDALAGQSKEA